MFLRGLYGLIACRGLGGEKNALVEFNYDGVWTLDGLILLPDAVAHRFFVDIVDTDGNVSNISFGLTESSPHHIATLEGHTAWLRSVAFSPDGKTLASGGEDRTVKLWDVATKQDISTLPHGSRVNSAAFSPDGKTLASGSVDATVKLWDVTTGANFATLPHMSEVNSVAFSRDGKTLASGSVDATVKLWDVTTGANFATLSHASGWINSVAFSRDGRTLASGGEDHTIKLWDVGTKANIGILEGHTFGVNSVAFSRDGRTLASGSTDATVKLWDVATGANFATLPHMSGVNSVAFSSDGTTLASGTGEGTVELWDTSGWTGARREALAEIDIPDSNLRAAIATTLGKPSSASIVRGNVTTLTHLRAVDADISNLTGLEGATKMISLRLPTNNISDISPLAELTKLTVLSLWVNNISDISPVAELTKLTVLDLGINNISDISPLAGLTNLQWLGLRGNNISDVSPLAANTGLGIGDTVDVQGNPLSYTSIHTHIPALQSRGVTVEFDNQTHPALLKISGDNQKGASFTPLSQPFVVEVQDANGSSLVGVSVTFAVVAGGGTLSSTITRTNENGRAQSTLTLGPNLGTNTVEVSAAGIQGTAIFHAISDTEAPPIIADVNGDGTVNVLDLIVVASELGNTGTNLVVDVNRDGVVSILDLILVAGMFEGTAAAPAAQPQAPETLTAVEVQGWLTDARALEVRNSIMKRGFLVLEQLLVSLIPTETELLHNYPNPFNPETWIPYRLAEDAFVTLTIYDGNGWVVRTFDVGHRIAAAYENRSKAIYWNGKNGLGESVASGVYFYTLTAGDYSATRKMLVLK